MGYVVGANLCARRPVEVLGQAVRGAGGVAGKEECTFQTIKKIFYQLHYLATHGLCFYVDNVPGLHSICVFSLLPAI